MDLSNLTSEQKKVMVLAGLVGMGVVYALMTFVVQPAVANMRKAGTELETVQRQLDRANMALNREPEIRRQLAETEVAIKEASETFIPPFENSLSWVAESVYRSAREVGVEIESVADLGVAQTPWHRNNESDRAFVPYTVRIAMQCGYAEMVRLIEAMERSNPYLCVSDIVIASQVSNPEEHRINFSVEWPYWVDPSEVEELRNREVVQNG